MIHLLWFSFFNNETNYNYPGLINSMFQAILRSTRLQTRIWRWLLICFWIRVNIICYSPALSIQSRLYLYFYLFGHRLNTCIRYNIKRMLYDSVRFVKHRFDWVNITIILHYYHHYRYLRWKSRFKQDVIKYLLL